MNKATLIKQIALRSGLSPRQADDAVAGAVETLIEALSLQQDVRLAGFGSFVVVRQPARKGRNPRTGEAISLPPRNKVIFRPASRLKQVLGGDT